jgi:large subunit ribosomal protein L23
MTRSPYQVLLKPIVTEKSVDAKERRRTLCFRVDLNATKAEIRQAVQAAFKVKVEEISTAVFPGKMRRRGRTMGYRPDWKKAYVKLQAGEKMPEYADSV